jgi:hypothetical protein
VALAAPDGPSADPCDRATWPLVGYDGTVYACCNQDLVERARPAHLVVGHAKTDPWPLLRSRLLGDPLLRTIRGLGPGFAARSFASTPRLLDQCGTCVSLGGDDGAARRCGDFAATVRGSALLQLAGDAVATQDPLNFSVQRSSRYGALVALGWEVHNGALAR